MSLLVAAVIVLNPVGLNILQNAFNSGEQLSRSLGQLIVYSAMGWLAVLGLIEFGIRNF